MGKKFISCTNGIVNRRFKVGESIPDGFYPGVTISEDRKMEIAEKRKKTMLERYGVENPMHSNELKDKLAKSNLEKYGNTCSLHGKDIEEKTKQTNLERYGAEYTFQSEKVKDKIKQSNLERYGVENPFQSDSIKDKIKQTNQKNLGVDYPMQSKKVQEKSIQTSLIKYGTDYPNQSEIVKGKISEANIKKYGKKRPAQSKEVLDRIRQTNLSRYGVEWTCITPNVRNNINNDSKPNRDFAQMLDRLGISYIREFSLSMYSYDFKVGNNLVEINPSPTHNTLWTPFDSEKGVDKNYHYNKSRIAEERGYRVIHVFDWNDKNKIVKLLSKRKRVFARECDVRFIDIEECDKYLNEYHLQNTCKGQDIRLGLYYNNELVSLMSFGKPRYNKNYEWELLRYCSSYNVVGGDNKLLIHFIRDYNPKSIISYCDRSKFRGVVYRNMGFTLLFAGKPSCHWYSIKEDNHITDNLLRQYGYDKLFNEHYGKGTSNVDLIIQRGYLPIYDCGQDTWEWKCM